MIKEPKERVLIVDDTPENIYILIETLKEEYTLQVAVNGEKALALARAKPTPDIILLDVLMPGMDGYQVCRHLKEDEVTKDIPVLFLTAKSETTDVVTGFKVGGIDYITKPFNALELTARIKNHLELKKSRDEINKLNQQLNKDVILADKLQRELLPPNLQHPKITIGTIYKPYQGVSGDFFNYVWNSSYSKLKGYILDITGHGIATALQISALNVLFREAIEREMPGAVMLAWINDRVCSYFHAEYFAAVLYYEIDFSSMLLTYVSGGINHFLASSTSLKGIIKTPGSFVGISSSLTFEEHTVSIAKGDTFYFLSDGLFDLLNREDHLPLEDFQGTMEILEATAREHRRWDDASAVCLQIGGGEKDGS